MTTTNLVLDRESIARVDATDQLTDVLAIPEHLRDALWKVESAQLGDLDSPAGLVVAGMGGSAIGGALAPPPRGDAPPRRARAPPPRGRSGRGAPPGCRRGPRPTRPSSSRATRVRPRRRWPATRRPASSAPSAWSRRAGAGAPGRRAATASR